MLKFFRGIRRKLIKDRRFKEFLMYAIGEILLVIVGILFALQINNWYENKKKNNQEISILSNLRAEQDLNLQQLDEKIKGCQERIKNDSLILQQIKLNELSIKEQELLRMLSINVYPITFDPSNGTIADILNSGKINLIRSKELRAEISEWESNLSEVKEAEKYHIDLSIMPSQRYLSDKIILRNVYKDYIGPSEHSQSFAFFKELEFENLLVNSLLNLKLLESRYLMIKNEINDMNKLIEKQISK